MQYSKTQFEVEQRDDREVIVKGDKVSIETIFPLLHASVDFRFNERWSIDASVDGIASGDGDYWNAGLFIRWRPSQIWDIAFGGRGISGKIDDAKMFNDVELTDYTFQIGRSF